MQAKDFIHSHRWLRYSNYTSLMLQFSRMMLSVFGLGLSNYAFFTVLTTTTQTFQKLLGLNSWSAIVKHSNISENESELGATLIQVMFLEFTSMLIAFGVLGIFLDLYLVHIMPGVEKHSWFIFVILFQFDGVATGYLRYCKQEKFLNLVKIYFTSLTFISVLFISYFNLNLEYYLLVVFVEIVLSRLIYIGRFLSLLPKVRVKEIIAYRIEFKLARDLLACSVESSVRALRDFDLNVVAYFFAPPLVAIFKISRTIADGIGSLSGPLFYSYFSIKAKSISTDGAQLEKSYKKKRNQIIYAQSSFSVILFILAFTVELPENYAIVFEMAATFIIAHLIWSFFQSLHAEVHILNINHKIVIPSLLITIGYLGLTLLVSWHGQIEVIPTLLVAYYIFWVFFIRRIKNKHEQWTPVLGQ